MDSTLSNQPWPEPIASYLRKVKPLLNVLVQNRICGITNTAGITFLYHDLLDGSISIKARCLTTAYHVIKLDRALFNPYTPIYMQPQRLFIAIEFPHGIIRALDSVLAAFKQRRLEAVHWVGAKNMHLTVRFLGDTYPERLELVKTMLAGECAGYNPFKLSIGGSGTFPNRGTPRVIWVGIQAEPELGRLQTAIERGCRAAGYQAEERPFSPHLTLGRVSDRARSEEVSRVTRVIRETQVGHVGECTVGFLTLFKSDLNPGGPVYTSLGRYKIGAAPKTLKVTE